MWGEVYNNTTLFVFLSSIQTERRYSSSSTSELTIDPCGMGGEVRMVRAPDSKPPFTIAEIKKAIPPHCFQRSILRSSYYLVHDLLFATLFYYIATNYIHLLPHPLQYLAWPVYMICQGCVLMGVWVIAHECGHHAFSNYKLLDDTLGLILHSALLVPYFSWRISHRRHHANTASLDRDEVFVPKTKYARSSFAKYVDESPILKILLRVTIGWPCYLVFNISGRKYERFTSHFDPNSPIYSEEECVQILISDIGLLIVGYVLYSLAAAKGLVWLICVYGVPLSIVNGFLVTITYLHHTHTSLPHYDSSEWEWFRGALSTMDRDYGFLNHVLHHITDTHVAHHLFSTMPHYHAMEATKAIKPLLGAYYRFDGTPIVKAIWREAIECVYIEPDQDTKSKGVFWYTS